MATTITAELAEAIAQGRAFLTTFTGRHQVRNFNPVGPWVTTNDTGSWLDDHGWMAGADQIEIDPGE